MYSRNLAKFNKPTNLFKLTTTNPKTTMSQQDKSMYERTKETLGNAAETVKDKAYDVKVGNPLTFWHKSQLSLIKSPVGNSPFFGISDKIPTNKFPKLNQSK